MVSCEIKLFQRFISHVARALVVVRPIRRVFAVVERVGLMDKLSAMFGGSGDLTLFAPSNDAFDRLPESQRRQLLGRHDNDPCITSKYSLLTSANIDQNSKKNIIIITCVAIFK